MRGNFDKYATEAKEKWGETDAYKECEQRTANQTAEEQKKNGDGLMMLFAEFGKIKHLAPNSKEAQNAVKNLQQYITDHYYTCTMQILQGLGQMYIADERFKNNIDTYGGVGTSEFVSKAIEIYCNKK